MKKFYLFRNSLLPLLAALAVMCAGSCSQEILEVPEDLMPETRTASLPQVNIFCNPSGVLGPDGQYFAMNRDYTFSAVTLEQIGGTIDWAGTRITVEAIDGSDDAIDILLQTDTSVKLRFTDVGVYRVHAIKWYFDNSQDPAPIMSCEAEWICHVPSFTRSITGPTSVILGGEYNFKLTYTNPDYPDPVLKITESVFNDPKYTIISNDGAGNYRIRFNQPGDYTIEPGVGWDNPQDSYKVKFSPSYHVKVFFRPEMRSFSIGHISKLDKIAWYSNSMVLLDPQNNTYTSLPFRVYFKFQQIAFMISLMNNEAEPIVDGEVCREAGESGGIILPITNNFINGLFYTGETPEASGRYWEITIPRDTCYLNTCYAQTGGPIVADPDGPIIVGPGKPMNPVE